MAVVVAQKYGAIGKRSGDDEIVFMRRYPEIDLRKKIIS
jgi:hypothetical protein